MHVHTIAPEDATGLAREFYDEDLADDGYISNISRLYSHKPEVLAAWRTLIGSIRDIHRRVKSRSSTRNRSLSLPR